jgi:hypothetical protein
MLDQPSELTINATAFKARCLGLMEDLARGRLKRVLVTKRGKVITEMTAAVGSTGKPAFVDDGKYPSYWGCMKVPGRELTEADMDAIKRELDTLHAPVDLDEMERPLFEKRPR